MSDENDVTSEVARVLREHFDPTGTERHDPYAAAVYEEAAEALAEAGLLRRSGTDHLAEDLRENTEALMAARARLADLTARIGFGDGVTEPQADNDTIVKAVNEAFTNSNTLWEVEEQVERVRALADHYEARQGTALGRVSTGNAAASIRRALGPQEAQIATQEPAGATQGAPGDSRTSGGLDGAPASGWATGGKLDPKQAGEFARMLRESGCAVNRPPASGGLGERLRALIPETYSDDGYFGVTAMEIGGFADEAERLEGVAEMQGHSARSWRVQAEQAQGELRVINGMLTRTEDQIHEDGGFVDRIVDLEFEGAGDIKQRVQALAQWFQDQGQVGYARKVEEAVAGTAPEPASENPFRMPEERE